VLYCRVLQFGPDRLEVRAQFFDLLLAFLAGGAFLINFAQRALFVARSPFFGGGDAFTGTFELSREFCPDLSELVAGFVELPADFLQAGFGRRVGPLVRHPACLIFRPAVRGLLQARPVPPPRSA
jgi:hypothetical protein